MIVDWMFKNKFCENGKMYFGKEVRIILKWKGKDAYLELKKREDKEAKSILDSFNRVKDV